MLDFAPHSAVGGVLAQIAGAVERLSSETTPAALLQATAREIQERLGARLTVVSRRDGERLHEIASWTASGLSTRSPLAEYTYLLEDYPTTRHVLETGRPAVVSLADPGADPTEAFVLREMHMDALLMLPLPCGLESWGLIEIYDVGARTFDEDEVALAHFFARQAGGLLLQLEHTEAVQRLYRETLASLANALEEKDAYTHDHTQEVVALAVEVGRALKLDDAELDLVELGALFHDIGKIRIPESILNKPGPLDDAEWGIMRSHTIAGEAILAPITSLREVLPIVRSSHERWDGRGYPDGLSGQAIPVGARIVSVCDAFRAMTERRPYRNPLTEREAVRELRRNAGTQFDPQCVGALLQVLRGRRLELGEERLHRPAAAA
jgi:putative nucleotidyltransferase with HDIG domain